MEENIDIYMDLPDFDLTKSDINDQSKIGNACNCEELKKKFNSLTNEFESMKKVNQNLETNLASLLKTAKAEIARKDRTIEELRNQLDNAAFRRNNRSLHFSTFRSYQHNTIAEMYETSVMNLGEDTFMSQQIEPYYTEYKSRKPQNNTDQVPVTIFGTRLHKKIMDDKREEKRLRASSKLSSETNVNKISEECIVESDKENGSESSINNANDAIVRSSSSGTSYKKDSGKRLNEENDTCKNKRLKTEDNEDREDYDTDYNHIAQYDTKGDLTKLEDQLRVMYSFKKEQIPLETKHRASSEYGDTRQARSCRNEWRREERTSSTRDYDNARTSKGSIDSSRNHRTASNDRLNSDHQHDNYINGYRKNDYRYSSSSSRSYSKSRSDYESSSRSRRLREKSSRTYRDRKYDDYKYDSRHKSDRSRRGYDSKETVDVRTRYNSRERSNLRDKLRHTPSDVEDRESKSSSYKSNKYDNRKLKETTTNVSEDKKSHRDGKSQENAEDTVHPETTQLNPANERVATTDGHDVTSDASNQHSGGSVTDYIILDALAIEEVYSNNNDVDDCKNCIDENVRDYSNDGFVRLEEMYDFSNESAVRSEEMGYANAEGTVEVDKMDNRGTNNDICQINYEDVKSSKDTMQIETVLNCDSIDKGEVSGGNETSHQISDKSNGEASRTCLDDHNYVRDAVVDVSLPDVFIPNVSILDASVPDASVPDASVPDASVPDASVPDASVPDASVPDASVPDASVPDASVPDASVPDASVPDASVPDTSIPDASVPDTTRSTLEYRGHVSSTITLKETETEETVNIQSIDVKKTTLSAVKNKKDRNGKAVVISRRRKAVTLSDNNASMIVLVNTDSARLSLVDNSAGDKNDSMSKPRACKLARTVKPLCK